MNNNLELLSMSKEFIVNKEKDYKGTEYYSIKFSNFSNLVALVYENNTVEYCVSGCYDSGVDLIEFDINELDRLRKFVELMVSNKTKGEQNGK